MCIKQLLNIFALEIITMKILALKLITGEDVLGEIESESETEFVLINPVGIAVVRGKDGQPSVGFAPFPIHAEQKSGAVVALAKKNVVYSYVPAEDFITNYNQIFGSGIIVPPTKQLITG
jgi:hypothetical protein